MQVLGQLMTLMVEANSGNTIVLGVEKSTSLSKRRLFGLPAAPTGGTD
jgi:hypothetical protein